MQPKDSNALKLC